MGCVITIKDEHAARASERDLLSLIATREGTCRGWFASEIAAACRAPGQLCCGAAGPVPTASATLTATLVPGGSGKCLAPSLA